MPRLLLAMAALALAAVSNGPADPWRDSAMPIGVAEDGKLAGAGGDWLLERGAKATFTLLGEQHGVEGIARMAAAAYRSLSEKGYRHLALETGPWIANRINAEGLDDALRRYPHSIAFDADGDMELTRAALDRSEGEVEAVWGLDQAFSAIHPLQRLAEIGPTWNARRLARGAFLKAALRMGEYSRQDHARDVAALRAAFGGGASEEARLIFDALEKTMEIYVAHRAAARGEIPASVSVEARETYMKRRLESYLEARENADGSYPKTMFKMGGAHVIRDAMPNGVPSLGDWVAELAKASGQPALFVGIRNFAERQEFPPSSIFQGADAALVDTVALRATLGEEAWSAYDAETRADLEGFDAIIWLKNAPGATKEEARRHEAAFKKRLILSVGAALPPLAILATALWPLFAGLFSLIRRRELPQSLQPIRPWLLAGGAAAASVALLAWQIVLLISRSPSRPAAIVEGFAGSVWQLAVAGLALACLAAAAVCRKRDWWTKWARFHYGALAVGLAWLACFMGYWNLGGMLGS